jgi:SAM-dependent methyltransferase
MSNPTLKETRHITETSLLSQLFRQPVSGISAEISADDTMFEGSIEHYFSVGESALRCIRLGLLAAGKNNVGSILDFACGFGRVLRVLKAAFPSAQLTVCDISSNAIDFCAKQFDARPIQSGEDFTKLQINSTFDLIWCGSLLTQLEPAQFTNCITFFRSLLSAGGLLVFTTHGPFVAERIRTGESTYGIEERFVPGVIREYDATGYGYGDYPDHILPMVGVKRYGVSISKPSWVCSQIERHPDLRILNYTERAWDNHQDSVACMRTQTG